MTCIFPSVVEIQILQRHMFTSFDHIRKSHPVSLVRAIWFVDQGFLLASAGTKGSLQKIALCFKSACTTREVDFNHVHHREKGRTLVCHCTALYCSWYTTGFALHRVPSLTLRKRQLQDAPVSPGWARWPWKTLKNFPMEMLWYSVLVSQPPFLLAIQVLQHFTNASAWSTRSCDAAG